MARHYNARVLCDELPTPREWECDVCGWKAAWPASVSVHPSETLYAAHYRLDRLFRDGRRGAGTTCGWCVARLRARGVE